MSDSRMNGKDKYFNAYLMKHDKINYPHDTEHQIIFTKGEIIGIAKIFLKIWV